MGGLTAYGFAVEPIDDIRTSLEADLRNTFFSSLPLGDKTLLGHINGMISELVGLMWERLEEINSSQDPDKASGDALRALSSLTGTFAQLAKSSLVTLTLCGDDGTLVASGAIVATLSTGKLFDTQDDATITLLSSWASTHAYSVGDRVTNAARCYACITAGTSAGSGGPTTTDPDITDGSAHWTYLGEGTAAIDVVAASEDTGEIVAVAGDLTVRKSPAAGWNSVRNLLDATLGNDESTDEELRLLRQIELAGGGASTRDSIKAAILKLSGVISASMFVNNTDTTNTDGVPPHAFEALVHGGVDQDIADAIANQQPAGVAAYGSSTANHTDSEGNITAISFSRPTLVLIYGRISVNYDVHEYPSDGDTAVKAAIALWGAGFVAGKDVDPSAVAAQSFAVDGVLGATRTLLYTDAIGSPVAWVPTTGYVATVGLRSVVTNDGGRCYICTTTGTSAGAGGPIGVGSDIVDGTAHWYFLGNIVPIAARGLATFDTSRLVIEGTSVVP